MLDEKLYRRRLDDTFTKIDRAFDDVDPDLAESNLAQGALTITMRGVHRLILSAQPSPQQLWVAFRDRAWHFGRRSEGDGWIDDRGQGLDLFALIEELARTAAGVTVTI